MRFLVDRCAGRRLAEWLRSQSHDVLEARELGPDPGDRALLERAAAEGRILVTIDTDFGELVYVEEVPHAGLVRLPDVPAERRIALDGRGS
jgi:predicted nuclease of predicted toxin-antitoxin system